MENTMERIKEGIIQEYIDSIFHALSNTKKEIEGIRGSIYLPIPKGNDCSNNDECASPQFHLIVSDLQSILGQINDYNNSLSVIKEDLMNQLGENLKLK